MPERTVTEALERAAGEAYGRLLAYLAARSNDIAACEDAIADAFVAALETWPVRGVPHNPDGWLFTAARNRLRDRIKHLEVRDRATKVLMLLSDENAERDVLGDERLQLLFVCAHPAIDPGMHTPLMLQVVLGLSAEAVARAFLRPAAGTAKRLVRAKAKIKRARIPFELPAPDQWPLRLRAVLDAIYAAYGRSWDLGVADESDIRALRKEALHLARVVLAAIPNEPEAQALLALILYAEARRPARHDHAGAYVPIAEQDTNAWDADMIAEAEGLLRAAATDPPFGRYQLEAALQSCHVARTRDGIDNLAEAELLYRALYEQAPTVGAWLGWLATRADAGELEDALEALKRAKLPVLDDHQPYWALRADLLRRSGQPDSARAAYRRAIALTADPAIRRWLERRAALARES